MRGEVPLVTLTAVFLGMIRRHGLFAMTGVTVGAVILIPLVVAPIRTGPLTAEIDRNLGLGILLLGGTYQVMQLSLGGLAQARASGALQMLLVRPVSRGRLYLGWIGAQYVSILWIHFVVVVVLGVLLWGDEGGGGLWAGTIVLGGLLVLRSWVLVTVGAALGALGWRPASVAGGLILVLLCGHLGPLVEGTPVVGEILKVFPNLTLYLPEGLEGVKSGRIFGATGTYLLGYGFLGWFAFRRMRA